MRHPEFFSRSAVDHMLSAPRPACRLVMGCFIVKDGICDATLSMETQTNDDSRLLILERPYPVVNRPQGSGLKWTEAHL